MLIGATGFESVDERQTDPTLWAAPRTAVESLAMNAWLARRLRRDRITKMAGAILVGGVQHIAGSRLF
jgi:hypothetical protein